MAYQTLMNCPGQSSHQFLTIALAAFRFPLKAPREPELRKATRRDSVRSQAAPRELRRDDQDKLLPRVLQISESLLETTLKSQSLPGR